MESMTFSDPSYEASLRNFAGCLDQDFHGSQNGKTDRAPVLWSPRQHDRRQPKMSKNDQRHHEEITSEKFGEGSSVGETKTMGDDDVLRFQHSRMLMSAETKCQQTETTRSRCPMVPPQPRSSSQCRDPRPSHQTRPVPRSHCHWCGIQKKVNFQW